MKQQERPAPNEPEAVYERALTQSACSEGLWLFLLTQVVIYGALAFNHIVLRLRSEAGVWPTGGDLQTPWLVIIISGLLLALAAFCLWRSVTIDLASQAAPVRKWIVLAAVFCLLSVGGRYVEMRRSVAHGIYPRSPRPMLYDRADILYVQAVRQELEQRYGRLEEKLRLRPDQFTDEDRADLERISQLQTDMISWTELDLALRLEDAQEKQARIETIAFQIHPVERLRPRVQSFLADEQQELKLLRTRLELLKDYYSAKSRLQRESRELERTTTDDNGSSDEQRGAGQNEEIQRVANSLEQLDAQWRSRLYDLPGEDQAALKRAMEQSSDWASTTQLAKQLDTQLGRVEGRQRFLEETAASESGSFEGLNQRYPWLKLPMLMPGANRWASSYFLMTGVQTLHLLILLVTLLCLLPRRSIDRQSERFARARLLCQFTVAAWFWVFCVVHFV